MKNKLIIERIEYILKLLKERKNINSESDLINIIYEDLRKFDKNNEKYEKERKKDSIKRYYKNLQNIKGGLIKKVPKSFEYALCKNFYINPDYLNGKSDIAFFDIATQYKALFKICKKINVAYIPYKFKYDNKSLKLDGDIEKYKFIYIKINSNLIKFLIEINELKNRKKDKDINNDIIKLYKKYKNEANEEYVLIKTKLATEIISLANENENRRKQELHEIVNLDFLNEINQNSKIANAKQKPYKITQKEKREVKESIEWQIKYFNKKITLLKKQLKNLNN